MSVEQFPKHIAIIMDGNGRWAQQLGKPRTYGHYVGYKALLKVVSYAEKIGVSSLTLYAFSSENWQRPDTEVKALMTLFSRAIKHNRRLFLKRGMRFNVVGDKSRFSDKLRHEIHQLEMETAEHDGLVVNFAANYGAKWDIVEACKALARQVQAGEISASDIDEKRLSEQLCLAEQGDVDLLIRTGGELRISNYLLWQCAYAEFYFTPIFWPEFDERALDAAISEFQRRTRRFGNVETPAT